MRTTTDHHARTNVGLIGVATTTGPLLVIDTRNTIAVLVDHGTATIAWEQLPLHPDLDTRDTTWVHRLRQILANLHHLGATP